MTLILSGVLFAWGISLTHGGHSANRAVANLLLIHAWDPAFQLSWNYPSWSISSEWFAYLMFPFLAILLSRLHWFAIVLFFVLMVGSSIAVLVMQKELPFRGILAVVPTFAGGAALAVICPPGSGKNVRYLDLVLFLSIVGVSFVFSTEWQKGIDLFLFFALIAVLGKMGAHSGWFWRWRPLVWMGEISYSLYMTHAITIVLLATFLPMSSLIEQGIIVRLFSVLTSLTLILVIATLMYHLVEKPCRSLSRRVKFRS